MKAYFKSIFRSIRSQWVQFVSIVLIIALGVSFFIGIRVTGSNMKDTADHYYQKQNLMDVQLLSSLGFDNDSLSYLKKNFPEVEIEAVKYQDFLTTIHHQDLSLRLFEHREKDLNQAVLLDGKWPENTEEIALDSLFMEKQGLSLGDKVTIDASEDLANGTYTIVGRANSVLYLNVYRGASRVGDGKLSGYGFLSPESFTSNIYSALWFKPLNHILSFDPSYQQQVDAWTDTLKKHESELSKIRLDTIKEPLQKRLDDAKKELNDKEIQANQSLSEARFELDQAKNKLEKAKTEIDQGIHKLFTELKTEQRGQTWSESFQALDEDIHLTQSKGQQQLSLLATQIDTFKLQIKQAQDQGAPQAQIDAMNQQLTVLEETHKTQSAALTQSIQALSDAVTTLRAGERDYNRGVVAYNQGKADYEDAKSEADQKISDARKELASAQQKIDDLDSPSFLIQSRKDMVVGYSDFVQDSDRISAIGQVFPAIFFLVAALVCLSSISRMVEEERTQTGVLQALGYSPLSIQVKYILYSGLASSIGIAIGTGIGFFVIPNIIFEAYRILYTMPSLMMMFKLDYFILPLIAALLCTVGVAIFVTRHNVKQSPANLMRPVAPKAGKRIFLERIPPLWKRLSFLHKVSLRNLLLDRSRFLMSVIGIAGCMGLLITGFGLNDSIKPLVQVQFDQITRYDTVVSVSNTISDDNRQSLLSDIQKQSSITEYLTTQNTPVEAIGDKNIYEAGIVVVEHVDDLSKFVTMRDYKSQEALVLNDDGVVIDQKLSELLGLKVHDQIKVRDGDREYSFKISAIMENYIGHSIYMTPQVYTASVNKKSMWNSVILNLTNVESNTKSSLSSELMNQEGVLAVTHISDAEASFADMMGSFDIVVVVIAGAASLLAFVVMTNLTSMNINERIKEIATLKVLGFYDKENYAYIMRENMMLVFIGCLFGGVFGYYLHQFIILTVEVDLIMFYRQLSWSAVLIAVVMTFAFSILVNLFMNQKIKKINMIEALKSVD